MKANNIKKINKELLVKISKIKLVKNNPSKVEIKQAGL